MNGCFPETTDWKYRDFSTPTFIVKLANMLSNNMTFVHTLVYKNVAWYFQIREESCGNETSFVINK